MSSPRRLPNGPGSEHAHLCRPCPDHTSAGRRHGEQSLGPAGFRRDSGRGPIHPVGRNTAWRRVARQPVSRPGVCRHAGAGRRGAAPRSPPRLDALCRGGPARVGTSDDRLSYGIEAEAGLADGSPAVGWAPLPAGRAVGHVCSVQVGSGLARPAGDPDDQRQHPRAMQAAPRPLCACGHRSAQSWRCSTWPAFTFSPRRRSQTTARRV